jgi:two-component system chemotaxis response regulator CheY
MSDHKLTPSEDIAATRIEMKKPQIATAPVTDGERNDESLPKPLVKVVNNKTGDVTQASLEQLNEQMRDFHKVILLIEDEPSASTVCATVLHEMGYDGVQLITQVLAAEQHLDDIVSNLTGPPAAIVLDLGLGYDSGFSVLRKCHAEPRLKNVPILVWTKRSDRQTKSFSDQLGANDFLVKSSDTQELREALKRLLAPKAA